MDARTARTHGLLFESAIKRQRELIERTKPDCREAPELELKELEERWEAEAPLRRIREILKRAGVSLVQDERRGPLWRTKTAGRWVDVTDEQAEKVLRRQKV